MKNSSLATKLLTAVICLVVLTYFGMQAYRYFHDPLTTTVAYRYEMEESVKASGWVVRSEQVLTGGDSGLLRLSRSEGEKVSKGGEIARIYADQASLDAQTEIDTLTTQIEQLQYAQEASGGSEASLKLDSQITDGILNLRAELSADRLDAAEEYISDLRSLVLKRDYTYSDADDLSGQIAQLQSQLKTLRSKAASSTKTVTAPVSGIYSAVVDGYETVLTPEFLTGLTPSALSAAAADEGTGSALGKLILGDTWYYAASVSSAEAEDLSAGKTVKLRFAKGDSREFTVQVESVSREENGRVAVVLSSREYLSEVTLLRRQSADLVLGAVSGIRVPESALRVSGDGVTGLYCVVGMVTRFKPVTVLQTGDGYALVKAAAADSKTLLRAGDQVIVTARDLYDGKVVG